MKLLRTIHRPDGMESIKVCRHEFKLPSGKTGTCEAPAFWELVYKTGMRQPFGAPGNIMMHTYRCDLHHTEQAA